MPQIHRAGLLLASGRIAHGGTEGRCLTPVMEFADRYCPALCPATIMARGTAEATDLTYGACSFRHVKGATVQPRHPTLLDALTEATSSTPATSQITDWCYEIELARCQDHNWGIVVEYSTSHKALVVKGVVRNSVADFWRRMPNVTKLQMGDQIVKINEIRTAHETGSFHPMLRLIMEQEECIKLLVTRRYPLCNAPPINIYEKQDEVPEDGVDFILSKNSQLPQVMGVTHYMVSNYSHYFAVPPVDAEIHLRGMNEDEKAVWTKAHSEEMILPHEEWYEKAFDLPQGGDLGIVVKYSDRHKALIVCGTVKDSFSHLEWQSRHDCRLKLQMGDQFVRINGCDTAHSTGSIHPRLRRIIARDNSYTLQVRRFKFCRSPPMKIYKSLEDITSDGSHFVLSRQSPLPYDLGVTSGMIKNYANGHHVSLELAELELRCLDATTKKAYAVPNTIVRFYEF